MKLSLKTRAGFFTKSEKSIRLFISITRKQNSESRGGSRCGAQQRGTGVRSMDSRSTGAQVTAAGGLL